MFPKLRKFSSISLITVFLFGGLTFPAYGLEMGSIFENMKTDDDKRWFKIGLGLRTSYGVDVTCLLYTSPSPRD